MSSTLVLCNAYMYLFIRVLLRASTNFNKHSQITAQKRVLQ